MRVLTLTMNPAIDQTIGLERLEPGQVLRADSVLYNAGGKGVNVSSCLADWGIASSASGIMGGQNAAIFEELFRAKGIDDQFLRVAGLARTNIKLVDGRGTTDINLPGPSVTPADLENLESDLDVIMLGEPGLVVLAGSLPQGCPPDIYSRLIARFRRRGWKVVLDAVGEALRLALAVEAQNLPHCIKPNQAELAELVGKDLKTRGEVIAEARALQSRGLELVVVSLGAEGALFVSASGVLHARGKVENLASTVGAGDAMVAGISAGLCEGSVPERLGQMDRLDRLDRLARLSTAFSVSKLGLVGPNLPPPARVEAAAAAVEITKVTL